MFGTMRPKHWIKNALILAPFVFVSGNGIFRNVFGTSEALRLAAAFLLFCAASSAAYSFNDATDAKADLKDPNKKGRTLSTAEEVRKAALSALILASATIAGAVFIWETGGKWIAAYIVVNALYSLKLKELELIDVACVTSGFAFRILCGCEAIGAEPGAWMLATVCACACYASFGKRLVKKKNGNSRIPDYDDEFLKQAMTVSLTLMIAFHAVWASSEGIAVAFGWRAWILTGTATFAAARYQLGFSKGETDDPTARLYKDPVLAASCLTYAVCALSVAV